MDDACDGSDGTIITASSPTNPHHVALGRQAGTTEGGDRRDVCKPITVNRRNIYIYIYRDIGLDCQSERGVREEGCGGTLQAMRTKLRLEGVRRRLCRHGD
eukprot:GHVU01054658.1.p2 GENE.GHVU01054658.1~~GHVU01054658.1.p2  ORF type:complete len:101 (+),score=12.78 GHVU01054658.1:110-412(+)